MEAATISNCSRKGSTHNGSYRESYTHKTNRKPEMSNHSSVALTSLGGVREGCEWPSGP